MRLREAPLFPPALVLLLRAADLFATWSEPAAAGEALSEVAGLCLEEGDATRRALRA